MNCNEDCVLVFGETSTEKDIYALKRFLSGMRNGLSRSISRKFQISVMQYKFISRSGITVVDQVRHVDVSSLFDFSCRESSWCSLYTHNGLVVTDLLLLLNQQHKWDGYRLEITLHGSAMSEQGIGYLAVA